MFIDIVKKEKKISTLNRTYNFKKIEVSKNRVDFEYTSYNHQLSDGTSFHKTKGYFLGDVNDISHDLPFLLEAIFLKKRKLDGIEIFCKTTNGRI